MNTNEKIKRELVTMRKGMRLNLRRVDELLSDLESQEPDNKAKRRSRYQQGVNHYLELLRNKK